MANREHKPYPKSERDRSTRPKDRVARLQMEITLAVLGDDRRYPTEMLTLRSRLAENPFSMIQRGSPLVSILPVVVACMTMCSGCTSKHDGMTLVVAFPDSAAIEPGSPVEFNGANVGVVGNITLGDGELVVELL